MDNFGHIKLIPIFESDFLTLDHQNQTKMKNILSSVILTMTIVILSMSTQAQSPTRFIQQDFDQLGWLIGVWQGANDNGEEFKEIWTATDNATKLSGVGYTMKNGNWIEQEKLTLELTATGDIIYNVELSGKTVPFYMQSGSHRRAIFENKNNDWPNSITYATTDESKTAITIRLEGPSTNNEYQILNYSLTKMTE